jgi:hypothetical protein
LDFLSYNPHFIAIEKRFQRSKSQIRIKNEFGDTLNLSSLKTPILERFHQRKVTVPRAFSMREGVKHIISK